MNTSRHHQLLTTFLTALGAVAASAVLGMNLAEQADQAAAQQQVEKRQVHEMTAQVHKLPTVLIEGRRQA
ncbi:hypothetical protein LNV09_04965 [Paucibacter sp. B2R-40]|jgi:hypothetical protein|uniref:hypothetical protein n=1 Tax=Paucibacter sp. B2R-40 TaxID=2893554 RepID=UPI0021E4913F|nr:hypothetical protein [Paucibacter sp. B2R-40]MCV2353508.1 hypothetical protein [Paucibacter sp. B2R-40]